MCLGMYRKEIVPTQNLDEHHKKVVTSQKSFHQHKHTIYSLISKAVSIVVHYLFLNGQFEIIGFTLKEVENMMCDICVDWLILTYDAF